MPHSAPPPETAPRSRFAALPGPLRAALWMVAGALIAVTAVLGVAMLSWPMLEQRPDWVADWLGEQIGHPVRIREMELAWQGSGPVIRLRDLHIDTGTADAPTLSMDTAEVRVDALGSLRDRSLRPQSVTVRGAGLEIHRDDDGNFSVAGFGLRDGTRADALLGAVMASLPAGAVFALENTRLTLHGMTSDTGGPGGRVLEPVSLHLRAAHQGLRLSGALTPREHPGAALRFALRWSDPASNPLDDAELTISARRLPLAALPEGLLPWSVAGDLDLDVDASVAGGSLASLRGTALLNGARLGGAHGDLAADTLESLLDFQRQPRGWTLTLLRLQARTDGRASSSSSISVSRTHTAPEGRYALHVDHLPVATLLDFARHAGMDPGDDSLLAVLQPAGHTRDLQLGLQRDAAGIRPVSVAGSVDGALLRAPGPGARLGPADLSFRIDARGGQVNLSPSPVSLSVIAGEPITFAAGGSLAWRSESRGLQFSSPGINLASDTSRLRITGDLFLPAQDAGASHASITARGSDFDAAKVKRYLAAARLPGALQAWLDGAIHDGNLRSLDAHAEGSLDELAALGGTLKVSARFDGAVLEYAPGWPLLEGLSGGLSLDGPRFALELKQGTVAGARIVSARTSVADVTADAPRVVVEGRVRGLTQQGAAFLAKTPMAGRFEGLLQQLNARGRASLALKLDIPLSDARSRVTGVVDLEGNTLKVGALRSAMDAVSGRIRFDRDGLRDGTLEAGYLGRRIAARIDGMRENRARTLLTIDGATDPRGLVQHLYDLGALDHADPQRLSLLSRLRGTTRWQVLLDMAHQSPLANEGIALTVRSDLQGMALELPAPLGKAAAARRELEVRTWITESGPRLFRVQYGNNTAALLERDASSAREFRLRRGDLRFGAPPRLPEEEGLRVSGEMRLLSVDEWVALIADAAGAAGRSGGPLDRVIDVDLRARRLVALGTGFDDVRVRVTRESGDAGSQGGGATGALKIAALGESVDGTIHVPFPVGSSPIDARFKTLLVSPASGVDVVSRRKDTRLDPRRLPDAHIVAERLAYAGVELGLAKLIMRGSPDGVALSEMYTLNQNFELRGSGSWTGDGRNSRSRFDLRIHSTDFGNLSKLLGYGDSGVEGGVSDVSLQANWRGTPFDFSLERVKGVLHFRATEGRLRDVEPGATGRVFGLLNVAVLPRRLLYLDFNDLFEEGIRYDLIEGSFRLDSGNAFSDNIAMHTQSARIDLAGRVGLVAEDYDQTMTVTPKLSASLPLAPLWLAEKLLNRKLIDSAFAYRYIISGSWDDPKIERVRVKAERSDAG